jgi:hypothetical protein
MWATCPRSASSGYRAEFQEDCYQKHAYQSQMQVASVKQSNVCHGREEAYYFGART